MAALSGPEIKPPALPGSLKRIKQDVEELGGIAPVFVDTSAVFFEGDDDSNIQQGIHARWFRGLMDLPGDPCVLVAPGQERS
jgi:hypothetical protein